MVYSLIPALKTSPLYRHLQWQNKLDFFFLIYGKENKLHYHEQRLNDSNTLFMSFQTYKETQRLSHHTENER